MQLLNSLFVNELLLKLSIFFFTIFAAVYLLLLIGEVEYLIKLLFNGGYTSWVLAFYDVGNSLRECELLLFNDSAVFDYVDSDIVVDKAKNIKVNEV